MKYLRNCWYVAGFSDEVCQVPLARKILDKPIVLYRTQGGILNALEDRCPHRLAPLSLGKVVGEDLECAYHGLRFALHGGCTFNPHYAALPGAAKVSNFLVIEKFGLIWIWMGDGEADPSLKPSLFDFIDTPTYATVKGYLNVQANYQLAIDNLLDLTHVAYLHPGFSIPGYSSEERLKSTKTELVVKSDRVTIRRWRPRTPPSKPNREVFGFTDKFVNARSHMHWMPPALIYFDAGIARLGEADELGLAMPAMHAVTPETEFSSHYFFLQARNMLVDDPQVDQIVSGLLECAFRDEDEPLIEAQQARMGNQTDIMALNPVLLKSDAAPVAARRILRRLIEQERTDCEYKRV